MPSFIRVAIIVACFSLPLAPCADPTPIVTHTLPAFPAWTVSVMEDWGTGVPVGPTTVITADHVLGTSTIATLVCGNWSLPANVTYANQQTDVCVLHCLGNLVPVAISRNNPAIGDNVTCLVYINGCQCAYHGTITALDGSCDISGDGDTLAYTLHNPICCMLNQSVQPGESGSGLFNEHGQLIGILSARTEKIPHQAWFIPVGYYLQHI
jgi:S1-C subfamily serine protease